MRTYLGLSLSSSCRMPPSPPPRMRTSLSRKSSLPMAHTVCVYTRSLSPNTAREKLIRQMCGNWAGFFYYEQRLNVISGRYSAFSHDIDKHVYYTLLIYLVVLVNHVDKYEYRWIKYITIVSFLKQLLDVFQNLKCSYFYWRARPILLTEIGVQKQYISARGWVQDLDALVWRLLVETDLIVVPLDKAFVCRHGVWPYILTALDRGV